MPRHSSSLPTSVTRTAIEPGNSKTPGARMSPLSVGTFWGMLALRLLFCVICVGAGYHFRPFGLTRLAGSFAGLLFGVAVILFEMRLRRASLRRLIGAVTGSILGVLGAYLTTLVLSHTSMPESTRSFMSLAAFLVLTY